ncbi:MAG: PIN domain-containing protein [Acidobacteriales bacterium]|nr:PIN domain-containing protein [Terriglobales bacterium]
MILDTNALSAFAEGNLAVRETIATSEGPCLPVVVVGEFRFGLMSSRNRNSGLALLEALTREWRLLDLTLDTTLHYAAIRHVLRERGAPIPSNDAWIAALARQHALPILTSDAHFGDLPGVDVLGWR